MMNWGITSREVVFGSQRASVGRKEDDSDVKDQTEGEDPAREMGKKPPPVNREGSRRKRPECRCHTTFKTYTLVNVHF